MIFVIFIFCYCPFYRFVNNMISAFHTFFFSGCQTIIMMVQLVRFCFNLSGCEREALSNVRPLRIPCSDVDFLFKSKRYKFRNSIQQKRACMLIWTKHACISFSIKGKKRSSSSSSSLLLSMLCYSCPLVSIYTLVLVLFIVLSIFFINVFLLSHTLSLHSLFSL